MKRFTDKIQYSPGCWYWKAYKNQYGYGSFHYQGRPVGAHKMAYLLFVGPIPKGIAVLHKCDNPACVNPDHLFLGTHKENMQDKVKKGRHVVGSAHVNSKLTEQAVIDIRSSDLSPGELAMIYGVHPGTIRNVINRKQWRHL